MHDRMITYVVSPLEVKLIFLSAGRYARLCVIARLKWIMKLWEKSFVIGDVFALNEVTDFTNFQPITGKLKKAYVKN